MELSNLQIAPSCVTPNGFGLFVLDKGYKKGERLPFTYQGVQATYPVYDKLNDYLVKMTHVAEAGLTAEEEEKHLNKLEDMFTFQVTTCVGENIDWNAVYDAFVVYSYEYDSKTKGMIFWPHYNGQGRVLPDERFEMYGLYMNEPPTYDYFYNTHDKRHGYGRMQESKCNVEIAIERKRVCFYALTDIEPYDELLMFYGVFFNRRDYEMNLNGIPEELWQRLRCEKRHWEAECQERFEAFEKKRRLYKSSGELYVAPRK
jgi:hypothetical protein